MIEFHPIIRSWFASSVGVPTRAQQEAWPQIASGENTLLLAPTGSGKTLAAFLVALNRLMFEPTGEAGSLPTATPATQVEKPGGVQVLYISPIKALAFDVERNLQTPLAEIAKIAEEQQVPYHWPHVAIRSGDSTPTERNRLKSHPPDILITTPESLYLILTSAAREILRNVEAVIIDEIHSLVATKRGTHLFVSLERLEDLREQGFSGAADGGDKATRLSFQPPRIQRIGLSATQRPLDEVARLLGGFDIQPANVSVDPHGLTSVTELETVLEATPRPVAIVDAGTKKNWDISVTVPIEDMARLAESQKENLPADEIAIPSIWPAIIPRLVELIDEHRSTMIFVNNRGLAERLAQSINDHTERQVAFAHHGSVAKDVRREIEEALKSGTLPAIVSTSSLELGIDMGAVDLVIQIEAPPSVASGLQRIGRAGHQVGAVSRGILFPKFRADLLAASASVQQMLQGLVESTHYPRNPLDVLAQQVVAIVCEGPIDIARLYRIVRGAAPYSDIPIDSFQATLDLVSGLYPSADFAEFKPRVHWDRKQNILKPLKGAQQLAIFNAGTIPDRGLYGVFLVGEDGATAGRVGELDEEMVFESRAGDVIMLGSTSWRIIDITNDRVLVVPAPGLPGRMPFWHGDAVGRPYEFGRAIGELAHSLQHSSGVAESEPKLQDGSVSADTRHRQNERSDSLHDPRLNTLRDQHGLDKQAAENLLAYIADQQTATGEVPSSRCVVVESYPDEMHNTRIAILSPFGSRVHAPWAIAVTARLKKLAVGEIDVVWSDDGILFRVPEALGTPETNVLVPGPEEIRDEVVAELGSTSLFSAKFREAAGRALLLPRWNPGRRMPLWQQRRKALDLLHAAVRFPSFPILMEAYRECLQDVFDLASLEEVLQHLADGEIRVHQVCRESPSPFAAALQFGFVGNFIYDQDAPLTEKKALALTLDMNQLTELLGEADLRQLLDEQVIDQYERELQKLEPFPCGIADNEVSSDCADDKTPRLSDVESTCHLLRQLGDLSFEEIVERSILDPDRNKSRHVQAWLDELVDSSRILEISVGGQQRFIVMEDASRYRDSLGIRMPAIPAIPVAYEVQTAEPLSELVARFARTHGPFEASDLCERWCLDTARVESVLTTLADEGQLVQGEFHPQRTNSEWCHQRVLATIKSRSLAKARQAIQPIAQDAFARFVIDWHGVRSLGKTTNAVEPAQRHRGIAEQEDAILDCIEQIQGVPLSLTVLEQELLPARVEGFHASQLDQLCAAGEVIWQGVSATNSTIRLFLAQDYDELNDFTASEMLGGSLEQLIAELLADRGAVFFDVVQREIGGFRNDVEDALWQLVWSGHVTNDSLKSVRTRAGTGRGSSSVRASRRSTRRNRRQSRIRSSFLPNSFSRQQASSSGLEGRWSLLRSPTPSSTETARMNQIRQLVYRNGVLSRETAVAESVAGGFSGLYPILRAMEEAGHLRRGYFVAGLGAAQFVAPGTEERLRNYRPASECLVLLAATDPANPYGASLPWPSNSTSDAMESRPHYRRTVGARVILFNGRLIGYWVDARSSLIIIEPDAVREVALALSIHARNLGRLYLETINGTAAAEFASKDSFEAEGFVVRGRGLAHRGL